MEDLPHVNLKVPLSLTAEYGFSSVEILVNAPAFDCIFDASHERLQRRGHNEVMPQVLPSYLRTLRSPLYNMGVEHSASVTLFRRNADNRILTVDACYGFKPIKIQHGLLYLYLRPKECKVSVEGSLVGTFSGYGFDGSPVVALLPKENLLFYKEASFDWVEPAHH